MSTDTVQKIFCPGSYLSDSHHGRQLGFPIPFSRGSSREQQWLKDKPAGRASFTRKGKKRREGKGDNNTYNNALDTTCVSVSRRRSLPFRISFYSFKGTPVSVPIELVASRPPGHEQLLLPRTSTGMHAVLCWYAWVSDVDSPSGFGQTRSRKRNEGKGNAPPPVDHQ